MGSSPVVRDHDRKNGFPFCVLISRWAIHSVLWVLSNNPADSVSGSCVDNRQTGALSRKATVGEEYSRRKHVFSNLVRVDRCRRAQLLQLRENDESRFLKNVWVVCVLQSLPKNIVFFPAPPAPQRTLGGRGGAIVIVQYFWASPVDESSRELSLRL